MSMFDRILNVVMVIVEILVVIITITTFFNAWLGGSPSDAGDMVGGFLTGLILSRWWREIIGYGENAHRRQVDSASPDLIR